MATEEGKENEAKPQPQPQDEKKDQKNENKKPENEGELNIRFSPEEEADLVTESHSHKAEANSLFTSAKYESALAKYDEAVAICPNYLDYELAVLRSNISACHLKLSQWKEAISPATSAIDGLERLEKEEALKAEEAAKTKASEEGEVEEEIVSEGAGKAAPAPLEADDEEAKRQKRRDDILRIRAKALLRRARARSEEGGWSNLAGAEEDYKALSKMTNLNDADAKLVRAQLRALPPRVKAAQEKETAEMWGKLKDLGNGILKPFGLSTDNFQMTQDPATGGYSMNFTQGGSGGGGSA